jgi:chorismate mutase/prephenate dehydratase
MELKEIREHLDRIDSALVMLLAERMSFIPKVAEYKKKNNLPRYQPEREKEILASKRKLAEANNLNPDLIETLFKAIIEDAHRIEKDIMGK